MYDEHKRLGAHMTVFAGWEMPLYYSSIMDEVLAVRSVAGIFDLSHMGEFRVSGPQSLDLVQFVTTNDASRLGIGDAQYTLMCNEQGGILDDLVVYRLEGDSYLLVVNASNTESDFRWVTAHNRFDAECYDVSASTGLVAIQGPASVRILQPLVRTDLDTLYRFCVRRDSVADVHAWIARTGYTGEDGFEIYCDASDAPVIWSALIAAGAGFGAKPAGLGARDILRLEAGYPLYGNELTPETTPVDAGILWVVKFSKEDFIGKQALMRATEVGPRQLLVGLEAKERCVPRHGYSVSANGDTVGRVTSGTFSPTLQKGIALAYVEPSHGKIGTPLHVQIRGRACSCEVVGTPFYRTNSPAPAAQTKKGDTSAA